LLQVGGKGFPTLGEFKDQQHRKENLFDQAKQTKRKRSFSIYDPKTASPDQALIFNENQQ
jgi:hypothetical protein